MHARVGKVRRSVSCGQRTARKTARKDKPITAGLLEARSEHYQLSDRVLFRGPTVVVAVKEGGNSVVDFGEQRITVMQADKRFFKADGAA